MEAIFVREDDTASNKLGVKGIGEIGIVGVAAAVANAVFNATGKRIREQGFLIKPFVGSGTESRWEICQQSLPVEQSYLLALSALTS